MKEMELFRRAKEPERDRELTSQSLGSRRDLDEGRYWVFGEGAPGQDCHHQHLGQKRRLVPHSHHMISHLRLRRESHLLSW